jgi:hypothetical protein
MNLLKMKSRKKNSEGGFIFTHLQQPSAVYIIFLLKFLLIRLKLHNTTYYDDSNAV